MSNLIKREDAIKATWQEPTYADPLNILTEVRDRIEAIPSADRPQGKWKAKSSYEYFCNNCGFSFDIRKCDFLENMKHCPNCGVRKGADDEHRG